MGLTLKSHLTRYKAEGASLHVGGREEERRTTPNPSQPEYHEVLAETGLVARALPIASNAL